MCYFQTSFTSKLLFIEKYLLHFKSHPKNILSKINHYFIQNKQFIPASLLFGMPIRMRRIHKSLYIPYSVSSLTRQRVFPAHGTLPTASLEGEIARSNRGESHISTGCCREWLYVDFPHKKLIILRISIKKRDFYPTRVCHNLCSM